MYLISVPPSADRTADVQIDAPIRKILQPGMALAAPEASKQSIAPLEDGMSPAISPIGDFDLAEDKLLALQRLRTRVQRSYTC
jgi:hypothetical protein